MPRKYDSQCLISCVMPTYGRPAFVGEAVNMFLAQDYANKELIIVNDCSAHQFELQHPQVRIVNQRERFPTLGEKRNAVIEMARGEIIAVWDDDDIYLPWRLSYSMKKMREYQTAFYRPAEYWAWWGEGQPFQHKPALRVGMHHSMCMFTKELWQDVDGYPAMDCHEDREFSDRVHAELDQEFLRHPIDKIDRFFILRGKSQYEHMSMHGGEGPLDTAMQGTIRLQPSDIADVGLRNERNRLVALRTQQETVRKTEAHAQPKISCLMVTQPGRLELAEIAARQFQRQSWDNRELVVVCDGAKSYFDELEQRLTHAAEYVRCIYVEGQHSLGELRNISVANATGEMVCQWDDDDQYHPCRLTLQANHLLEHGFDLTYLTDQLHFFSDSGELFWVDWSRDSEGHCFHKAPQEIAIPGTLLALRHKMLDYQHVALGEDSYLIDAVADSSDIGIQAGIGWCYLYVYHGDNSFARSHHKGIVTEGRRVLSKREVQLNLSDNTSPSCDAKSLREILTGYEISDLADVKCFLSAS